MAALGREDMMMKVANTIFTQLGGNRFVMFTGSKDFVGDSKSLRMRLARNASGANRLKITLNSMDTYDMEFTKYTPSRLDRKTFEFKPEKCKTIKTVNGVCCDQLQEIFTDVTGLYTHF